MLKSSFCAATGKCAASAYQKIAEGARQAGTFLGKAAQAFVDLFSGRCRGSAENERSGEADAPEKSSEQMDAVFSHAMSRFGSQDPAAHAAALRVFERLGKAESVARATALLSDPDAGLRARAQEVLRELNPEQKPGTGASPAPGNVS